MAAENDTRPTIAVFSLGGTIAMTSIAPGTGVAPTLTAAQLLDAIPGLDNTVATLDIHSFRQLPGASLAVADIAALAEAIQDRVAAGAQGVVVTQGTDTIEETAYLLDLLYDGDAPIVVTGAMRNPTMAGADGPANLLAAIHTALSTDIRGLGCLVVMSDEIHAARFVRKGHSASTAAFCSPNVGPIGRVVEGDARVLAVPAGRLTVPDARNLGAVRVALVTATLGDDGSALASVGDGTHGVIVAGFGVGHVPASWVAPLDALARRVPVVLASRTGSGAVLEHTYGFPGSEQDLLDRGLIYGGFLDPYKARILLHVLLAAGRSVERIAEAFAVSCG